MSNLIDLFYMRMRITKRIGRAGECWEWNRTRTAKGYGQIKFKGKRIPTHRLIMHLTEGFDLNSKLVVCHKCDNPPCINPAHLFVGTSVDNMQDCKKKGRLVNPTGVRHGQAKLNDYAVRAVRLLAKSGMKSYSIGKAFNVSRSSIDNIIQGKTWGHVR